MYHGAAVESGTSTSYGSTSALYQTSTSRRPTTNGRPRSARPRTATSTIAGDQQIICAISESRGISPVVGLAFVNLSTAEACLCQISDNQTFPRTLQKLQVYDPSEILFMSTANNSRSRLLSLVEANLNARITYAERKYWSETAGIEYIQKLAFKQDVEAIKLSADGNFYATCCLAAVLKYIEVGLFVSFSLHSLRMKYESSEGSMMIDVATIYSLELIQNLQNPKSKDCLFGLLNQTLTPMGARKLKSTILQPSTDEDVLEKRYTALAELTAKEDVFFAVRQALKSFVDTDRVLTAISIIPTRPTIQYSQQSINNVIMLKQYVKSVRPIYEALANVQSDLLRAIAEKCAAEQTADIQELIDETINEDITFQKQPLDLRNQRTYAVKSGVNGLLDVARQTYKESNADAYQLVTDLATEHNLALDLKYDSARQYYIRLSTSELIDRDLPAIFINVFRKKNIVECQTLDLLKWNQKIIDSHHEVVQMSDQSIQKLIDAVREDIAPLFKISEAIALLDMMASFAQMITTQNYVRPEISSTLAIKNGRHPIREKIYSDKYVPNDVYATQQSRFQIITGCNMSGKSCYIRSIALVTIMAQLGSFVPATFASFRICHQLFARVSTDDSIEANVSTFAAEMRETAFILRNIDKRSMVIIDELGRGTSTRDGLCIAIAVAEALVDSGALVWFATHFRDLPRILAERSGVVNLHLEVELLNKGPAHANTSTSSSSFFNKKNIDNHNSDNGNEAKCNTENSNTTTTLKMLYRIANGAIQETNYGLALAKVIGLPDDVIDTAETVSAHLAAKVEQRKRGSKQIALTRRRKLILALREQLVQARESKMRGKVLAQWLKELQDQFVMRMVDIDAEVHVNAEFGEGSGDEEGDDGGEGEEWGQESKEVPESRTRGGAMDENDVEDDDDVDVSMEGGVPIPRMQDGERFEHGEDVMMEEVLETESEGWCVRNDGNDAGGRQNANALRYEMSGALQVVDEVGLI